MLGNSALLVAVSSMSGVDTYNLGEFIEQHTLFMSREANVRVHTTPIALTPN